jgi:hypothetical protein
MTSRSIAETPLETDRVSYRTHLRLSLLACLLTLTAGWPT